MKDKILGISEAGLVGKRFQPAKRSPQYIASLSATLGALAAGMVLAWTSSAGTDGKNLQYLHGFEISVDQFSWLSSLTMLGAGAMCLPIGFIIDLIGRKSAMLLMVVPFTVGWLLIIFAKSVLMFYLGRFITGAASGAFCIAAPIYTAEISESAIRGSVGTYFQLLLSVGISLSYTLGYFVNIFTLSVISAIVPLIFFTVFMFMPESPIYYLQKNNVNGARKSYIKLYGAQYDIEGELERQRNIIEETRRNKVFFSTMIKSKITLKGFVIAYGLMFFQQFSGVNTIVFYATQIFAAGDISIPAGACTIILAVIQILMCLISSLVVDRVGRRALLLSSIIFLCLTTCALGFYYHYYSGIQVDAIPVAWLPLVCVCLFSIMFSLGFGPVPWLMLGEIFAPNVKGAAASSAGFLSWALAFLVTKLYGLINIGVSFWMFSGISAIGIIFVYVIVPETKGKRLEDVLKDL
ncbi:facilitated trehalose transporter Tret1-2 homolog [Nomia melanderi]|uniref:facilitated trehalose transporter Tret1-2 homolog n=1 Tax=Nomia melanderi TaxID=2448451 RepID=UPI0013040C94|nr:facilitated trehalose transporter Tret1-2 homolog [Nomia melanderi]